MAPEGRAEIGSRTIMGDQGSGTQWFVRAPDGYLIDCGGQKKRAERVRDSINFAGLTWTDPDPF